MEAVASELRSELAGGRAEALAAPGAWSRIDNVVLVILVAAAAATRFWRLGYPDMPVFDEGNFVGQAGTYLRGEQYIDPHPPLARELMALCMWLFGPAHPWAWRFSNAAVGTALVGLSYALGRRLFASRLAGALAASFVLLDGLFLVDSRTGVLEIVYLTLAALAYLLFFHFLQDRERGNGKRTLLLLGISLGLCLGAKLLLPGVTFLLVMGFLTYALAARSGPGGFPARRRLILAAWLLVGSTAVLGYVVAFLPNYLFLGWGGVQALVNYGRDVLWYEGRTFSAVDERSSPWWSWPFLLHPFIYWQKTLDSGQLSTIWFGGNPVLWWASLGAIGILCARLISRPSLTTAFVVTGYFSYLAIEIPITRPMYLYHYMPSQYLAYVALGAVVSECWRGEARRSEQALLLATLAPSAGLAIGGAAGLCAASILIAASVGLLWLPRNTGRPVCVALLVAAVAAFVYFYPIWTGLPTSSAALEARMWLDHPGVFDWMTSRW